MTEFTANHPHPAAEILVDYGCGAMTEGETLAIAIHLTACAECRQTLALCEEIGGTMFDAGARVELPADLLNRTLAMIGSQPAEAPAAPSERATHGIPTPLATYVGGDLNALPWRRFPGGYSTYRLSCHEPACHVRLLRIAPGSTLPRHRHNGDEWMAVVQGSFDDVFGHHAKGDFVTIPDGSTHALVSSSSDDCICLSVTRAGSHFHNPVVRFMVPIIGF